MRVHNMVSLWRLHSAYWIVSSFLRSNAYSNRAVLAGVAYENTDRSLRNAMGITTQRLHQYPWNRSFWQRIFSRQCRPKTIRGTCKTHNVFRGLHSFTCILRATYITMRMQYLRGLCEHAQRQPRPNRASQIVYKRYLKFNLRIENENIRTVSLWLELCLLHAITKSVVR